MYISNRIRIPTHGVDLGHQELHMEVRTKKSPMGHAQGEEMRGKKERGEEERERRADVLFYVEVTSYPSA
jgi:hypothetical protein